MKSFKEHVLDEDTHKGLSYHLENKIPLAENIYRYGSKEFFNTINEARRLYEEEKIDLSYADIDFLKTDIGSFGVYEGEEVPLDFPMEEIEEINEAKHRVNVTVSDPNHTMVTKRKEKISKNIKVSAGDKDSAIEKAKAHYKKMGMKVHDAEHIGIINEDQELSEDEDKKTPPIGKPMRGGPKKFYVYVRKPDGGIKKVTFGDKGGAAGGGTLSVKMNDPVARKSFAARHQCHLQKDRTSAAYWSCNLPRYAKSLGLSGGGSFYW